MPSAGLVLTEEVCALVGNRLRLHPLVDVLVLLQNLLDEDVEQPDALGDSQAAKAVIAHLELYLRQLEVEPIDNLAHTHTFDPFV